MLNGQKSSPSAGLQCGAHTPDDLRRDPVGRRRRGHPGRRREPGRDGGDRARLGIRTRRARDEPGLRRATRRPATGGARARRRHRDHGPPRLPVHAEADHGDGLADRRRRVRRRDRVAHPRGTARCGRHAALQVRREPCLDPRREPAARAQAVRVPQRLSGVLARCSRRCRSMRTPTTSSSTTRCSCRRSASAIVAEVCCPTRYFPEASSINLRRSSVYRLGCLWNSVQVILCPQIGVPAGRQFLRATGRGLPGAREAES